MPNINLDTYRIAEGDNYYKLQELVIESIQELMDDEDTKDAMADIIQQAVLGQPISRHLTDIVWQRVSEELE